jgi:general secretion pathway protein N
MKRVSPRVGAHAVSPGTRYRQAGHLGWTVATVVAGLLAVLTVLLVYAPASLADWALDRATQGRVRLADASGSLWAGRGRLVLADLPDANAVAGRRLPTVAGVVIPGTFRWRLSAWPLLVGVLDARIEHDSMKRPVVVSGNAGELRISAGGLTLPPVDLDRLGSPWNTIRPTGTLAVSWENVTLRSGRFDGRAAIELSQAASALTPVRPLGAYRIDIVGSGPQAQVQIHTLSGPLRLDGSGTWDARAGLRFTAEAQVDESERIRLQPLLGLLGRRDGDRTIIRIGA